MWRVGGGSFMEGKLGQAKGKGPHAAGTKGRSREIRAAPEEGCPPGEVGGGGEAGGPDRLEQAPGGKGGVCARECCCAFFFLSENIF